MNPANHARTRESGLIGLLVVLFVALIIAKYLFNWSIFTAASTPQGQDTISYSQSLSQTIWHFVSTPFFAIWNRALEPVFSAIGKVL